MDRAAMIAGKWAGVVFGLGGYGRPRAALPLQWLMRLLAVLFFFSILVCGNSLRAQEVPLSGEAFAKADEAYKAFNKGDYATAAARAREAVTLRPDVLRIKLLLVDSLVAAGDLNEADKIVSESLKIAKSDEMLSRQSAIRLRLASDPAASAYSALSRGDSASAIGYARMAIERAPDVMAYRLLLFSALLADNRLKEADEAVNSAVELDRDDYVPLIWRAYLRQRLGQRSDAISDYALALGRKGLSSRDERNIRIITADAALAAGEAQSAIDALQPLVDSDQEVAQRRAAAREALDRPGHALAALVPPAQDCRPALYAPVCSLSPTEFTGSTGTPEGPGYVEAEAGFKAYGKKNYAAAAAAARKAIALEPDNKNYHMLLIDSLVSQGKIRDADRAISEALSKFPDDKELLARRRGLRQQAVVRRPTPGYAAASAAYRAMAQHDYVAAIAAAKKAFSLNPSRQNRLLLADAELDAHEPALALEVLAPLDGRNSYDVAARRGYALQALNRRQEALEAFQIAASMAGNRTERADMLAAQIGVLVELGRKAEALSIFRQALDQGEFASKSAVDIAFLASQVGDDQLARVYFGQAHHASRLSAPALQAAAYASKRTYHNDEAIEYFREAIDANTNGATPADPQGVFALRREVAELSRTWGFNASITDSRVGSGPGFFAAPKPAAGWALVGGAELYWRPPVIGNLNGSTFDVVVRAFETIDAKTGPTGGQTVQGMTGVRWKPFGDITLVFEADRVFKIGSQSINDWLLRTAFFYGVGTDLRVDVPTWTTWQIYADFNHFVNIHENTASFDLRIGQSFRLDSINSRLVLFPHLGFFANYDNKLATPQAYAVGPGAMLRYWFREDWYTAPMSYVDLTAQYRFRIDGDKRAEGIFAQALVNY
jgi:tetratricopeptide (TPR) repeat protein